MEQAETTRFPLKTGDKEAFEQLFKQEYTRLCLYSESFVRDSQVAEDVVQTVFCLLWEKREEIEIRESLKAYLYRSVYNTAMNALKREKVKRSFIEIAQQNQAFDENTTERFFDMEFQEELMGELNRVIDSLPEQCREVLMLSRFAGKKSSEIAAVMGISVRTVETQLYRAMKKLREELSFLKYREILFFIFLRESCK